MDEFKFVLRSLLLAIFIMFISQYKFNNETLESKAEQALVRSESAEYLREMAAGGVKFIRVSTEDGINFLKKKMAHNDGDNRHEPAKNRSNLED